MVESFCLGRQRRSKPAETEDEIDVDVMRAIHLSLMQRSTQTNQRSRQSSSSSSSTSSYRDQAHGVQAPQDMSYLSAVDGASLQKAIELSLRDSAVGGGNTRLFLLVKLKTQGCHFLSKK